MLETVFRTEDVPVAERFDAWRDSKKAKSGLVKGTHGWVYTSYVKEY